MADDSSIITEFQTPGGNYTNPIPAPDPTTPPNPTPPTATPGETITLFDQYSVTLDPNTSSGDIIVQDTLNGVIPASDVVVSDGGSYGAGIITWDLGTYSGPGGKGSTEFGALTAQITVPSDYMQDYISSLATITPAPDDSDATDNQSTTEIRIVCFCSGTRIKTLSGHVAVEQLQVGDRVVTVTGKERPIRWIGHRTIRYSNDSGLRQALPVRILEGAFGQGLPARDLTLSPGHPVLVGADENNEGGHLVPIMCLVNGTTIARVSVDTVTYWHVELDAHDILLAEGLPAESYFDLGSRPWFDGADGALYDPDLALPDMPGRCRPVAISGPIVEAERRRLDMVFATRLASAAAWPDVEDALAL